MFERHTVAGEAVQVLYGGECVIALFDDRKSDRLRS